MKKLVFTFVSLLFIQTSFSKESIDYAYSFDTQKLSAVDFSKNFHTIVVQEGCPACYHVYNFMDNQKKKLDNVFLAAVYEPNKRWKKKHKKYTDQYGIFSAGNFIKEKGVYVTATPALYSWDAKKGKGTLTYGPENIKKIFKSQK